MVERDANHCHTDANHCHIRRNPRKSGEMPLSLSPAD